MRTITNPECTTDALDRLHHVINERRKGTTQVKVNVDDLIPLLNDFHRYASIVRDAPTAQAGIVITRDAA